MAAEPGSAPPTLFDPAYRRSKEDHRFDASAERYLVMHSIPEYLSDAICLMTESDDSAPLEFLSAYFQNVLTGDNVIFRNFSYIDATNRNRRSFVRHLRETYQKFDPEEISAESLHQLFCLLCPDYPINYIRCAIRLYYSRPRLSASQDMDLLSSSKTAPFAEFMQFACLFFYFSKFIAVCGKLFAEHGQGDSTAVNRRRLQEHLLNLADANPTLAIPDQHILDDVLHKTTGSPTKVISFDTFCCAVFSHKDITMALLEPRSYTELKEGIDRLLEKLSIEQSSEIVRTRRKPKRNDKKDPTTIS